MFKQGIAGLCLALLTATPVLAQMAGTPPASTSNTGGTQGPANGEPPNASGSGAGSTPTTTGYGNADSNGYGPSNTANGACSSAGTPKSGVCSGSRRTQGTAQATHPPRSLLHD